MSEARQRGRRATVRRKDDSDKRRERGGEKRPRGRDNGERKERIGAVSKRPLLGIQLESKLVLGRGQSIIGLDDSGAPRRGPCWMGMTTLPLPRGKGRRDTERHPALAPTSHIFPLRETAQGQAPAFPKQRIKKEGNLLPPFKPNRSDARLSLRFLLLFSSVNGKKNKGPRAS